MVTDQFLNGFDSHELRVQVATTGARQIEDLMRIAQSLEAMDGVFRVGYRTRETPHRPCLLKRIRKKWEVCVSQLGAWH